jgi:hypothetical protein
LNEGGIEDIVSFYSSVFDDAEVVSTILIGTANTKATKVKVLSQQDNSSAEVFIKSVNYSTIEADSWREEENNRFYVSSANEQSSLIHKIHTIGVKLADIASYSLGMQVYHNTIHSKEEMEQRISHASTRLSSDYVIDAGGKHIHKYYSKLPEASFVSYTTRAYHKPSWDFFSKPRIVVREIPSKTLIATFIDIDAVFNKSTIIIIPKSSEIDIFYLLAVLNSSLIGFYTLKSTEKGEQRLFPRISLTTLKNLPIPAATPEQQAGIASLVEQVLAAKATNASADTAALEEQIDELVAALYGLTPAEVALLSS